MRRVSHPLKTPHEPMTPPTLCVEQAAPFSVSYVKGGRQQEKALIDDHTLAVIRFDTETQIDANHPHRFTVGLPELEGQHILEVWRSPLPVQRGTEAGIGWIRNEIIEMAWILVDESVHRGLEDATYHGYHRLLSFIRKQGYQAMLRVWNYFPNINDPDHDLERYKGFCRGRYRALAQSGVPFEANFPAACAIGTRCSGLLIYCLATKTPGSQIENPRQMSAFRYPLRYSPKSPSFSRAILKHWTTTERHLYVSGTASIVGHRSRHPNNVIAQLQETLQNLDALVSSANNDCKDSPLQPNLLKVYARPGLVQEELQPTIARHFGNQTPTLFLQGDICRRDLLLEIEGLWVSVD